VGSRDIRLPETAGPFHPAPTDRIPDTTKNIRVHHDRQRRAYRRKICIDASLEMRHSINQR
jgi:hypothetical protein